MSPAIRAWLLLGVTLLLGICIGVLGGGALQERRMARVNDIRRPGGFVEHVQDVIRPTSDSQWAKIRPIIESELGQSVEELFAAPRHPYTVGLLSSLPTLDQGAKVDRLRAIPGSPPDLARLSVGCRFHPRCPLAIEECMVEDVRLRTVSPTRAAACIRHAELDSLGVVFGVEASRVR